VTTHICLAADQPDPFVYPPCAHCGLLIEDRGDPNPFGPWEIRWVHVDWGGKLCHPQQGGDSPRAEPAPTEETP
jgi:hypothetical protein